MTSAGTETVGRTRLVMAAAAVLQDAGIESPRLDAEVLLAHVLGVSRLDLLLKPSAEVPSAQRRRFAAAVRARARHEPVAYLTGSREFYGRSFSVDRRVLVPRPETEVLAGAAIAWLRSRSAGRRRVLDLGTGSGCLAITIALETEGAGVTATDLSEDALEVARSNGNRLSAGPIAWRAGDLFDALDGGDGRFDLVVSNPPYVTYAELDEVDRSVSGFEPRSAWFSGEDALVFHRRILAGAGPWLAEDGAMMMEVGSGAGELLAFAEGLFAGARRMVVEDLAGWPRVVVVDWTAGVSPS